MDAGTAGLVRRFERQAQSAVQRSSSLYQLLLGHCARDLAEQGPTWWLLADRAGEPAGDALPLRLMAAVHWLVLSGRAPDVAFSYPSTGGGGPPEQAWPAFRSLLENQADDLRTLLDRPLQTNEVRRCSAVLVGLGWITTTTNRAPTVLEIGASAGLNLNWHRYRYQGAGGTWGPTESPVRLRLPPGAGPWPPSLTPSVEGIGCDRAPLDIGDAGHRRWLRSCVWADQVDRLAALDAALTVARDHPPVVESGDAAVWLDRRLSLPPTGTTTVVVQTIVQQYLSGPQRAVLTDVMTRAGARATMRSPLAWLRMEPPEGSTRQAAGADGLVEVRVRLWPGNVDHLLGYASYHGQPIHLIAQPSALGKKVR